MNTILRGSPAALRQYLQTHPSNKAALRMPGAAPDRCYHGLRALIDALTVRHGRDAVTAVLARYRAVASLVPGLVPISPDPASVRRWGAVAESHLSHNLLIQAPLFEALGALLAELLTPESGPLVVENLADLDRESLAVLRALYRRHAEAAPPLLAGYDPAGKPAAPDVDGLIWDDPAEDAHRIALAFAAQEGSEVRDLGEMGGPPSHEVTLSAGPAPESAVDIQAFARLHAGPLRRDTVVRSLTAIRRTFTAFAFTTTLRLGRALLEHEPELTEDEQAEVHGLLALAAHNRQFRSRGNEALARFLEHHLLQALKTEQDSARRSGLCYRLAVTLGRRQKRFDVGLDWANRAVEEARTVEGPAWRRAHLEAWGRNIRAYVLMGLRQLDEATADCEAAFEQLDIALADRPQNGLQDSDPRVREAAFTHSLIADNLAALAKFQGRSDGFTRWKTLADDIAVAMPGLVRFEAILWVDLYRASWQLELAFEKAAAGFEASRREQDPLRQYNYQIQMADLCDRLGDAARALECFAAAISLRQRLGDPEILHGVDASAAMAAVRAGRLDEAARWLDRAWERTSPDDRVARAQLSARRARIHAASGAGDAAEQEINRGIELAVASGERETLVDVAVLAGRVARQLRRPDEAVNAFRRALELAAADAEDTVDSEANDAALAAPRFIAHVGLAELDPRSGESLVKALELLPLALETAESWWQLERLSSSVSKGAGEDLPPELVQRLCRAVASRDCRLQRLSPPKTEAIGTG